MNYMSINLASIQSKLVESVIKGKIIKHPGKQSLLKEKSAWLLQREILSHQSFGILWTG